MGRAGGMRVECTGTQAALCSILTTFRCPTDEVGVGVVEVGGEVEVLLDEAAAQLAEVKVQLDCTRIRTVVLGSLLAGGRGEADKISTLARCCQEHMQQE